MNKILDQEFQVKFYGIMCDYICGEGESIDIRVKTGKILEDIKARPSKSDKGKISYLRNGKRMQLSIRRFLTRILHLNDHLSDTQLDVMTAQILTVCKISDHKFEYLVRQEIQDAYETRIGGGSCMTGDCNKYVGLYRDNPDRIKLAVVRYNNSSARCIVWIGDDKKSYYDRIYADSSYCGKTLEKELLDQDVIKIFECSVPVTVSNLNYTRGEIPYLDTMYYGTFSDNKLTLKSGSVQESYDEILQGQNGNDGNEHNCSNCGDGLEEDEIYSACDEVLCETCYNENYDMCKCCRETFHNDDITYVSSNSTVYCESCLSDQCFECESCNELFHNAEINSVSDDIYCNNCYSENYSECVACKEISHNDDMNDRMCKECATDYIICSKCDVVSDKYIADNGICADCNGMFCNV